jgi:type II secretory pathway pseudopilin PulG
MSAGWSVMAWLGTLWGRVAAGAAVLGAVGASVLFWLAGVRRRARDEERARITAETQARELDERRQADAVEDAVAGLTDDQRRRRLRERWTRG